MTRPKTTAGRSLDEAMALGYSDAWTVDDRQAAIAEIEREAFWNGVKSVEEVHNPQGAAPRAEGLPLGEERTDG